MVESHKCGGREGGGSWVIAFLPGANPSRIIQPPVQTKRGLVYRIDEAVEEAEGGALVEAELLFFLELAPDPVLRIGPAV